MATTERMLVDRVLKTAPKFANIFSPKDLPIYHFFLSLEMTLPSPGRGPGLLMPLMLQPDPLGFWSQICAIYKQPKIILLYNQNNGESMDGGLSINLQTYNVV